MMGQFGKYVVSMGRSLRCKLLYSTLNIPCGLLFIAHLIESERFRWCKYVEGQKFGMHVDARFVRHAQEKSFYTVNVYLNDGKDFEGGQTRFYKQQRSGR